MVLGRVASRFSRNRQLIARLRRSVLPRGNEFRDFSSVTDRVLHPIGYNKAVPGSVSLLNHSALKSPSGLISSPNYSSWFGFSSSAAPRENEKETAQSATEPENKAKVEAAVNDPQHAEDSASTKSGDSDLELSKDDLVKLVLEKEQLLLEKEEEVKEMKDKVLRTLAEMENVKFRTNRESDNAKKFAIQNFAKGLLDVADNLSRASTVAKENFSKVDLSKDTTGAVQQLKTLLEGVEMTEKQLLEVFKKYGLVKYEPVDEEFDPTRHNAIFQVPTTSKPEGQVAVVLKAGYSLHDRVVRPAEVGVTVKVETGPETEKSNV